MERTAKDFRSTMKAPLLLLLEGAPIAARSMMTLPGFMSFTCSSCRASAAELSRLSTPGLDPGVLVKEEHGSFCPPLRVLER